MVQGYYTLEEAAQILGMASDKLSQMAQRREIRAFADRGTWRFRTQDVEEMARRLGLGSNPDLQLGEAKPQAKAPESPPPQVTPKPASDDVFQFELPAPGDQVEIGQEILVDLPSSSKKSGSKLSPAPKPGSDSDVRLVPDSAEADLHVVHDSDIKLQEPDAAKSAGKPPSSATKRKTGLSEPPSSATKKRTGLGSEPPSSATKKKTGVRVDSGVRLVPMEDAESVAPITGQQPPRSASDSDIRIEASTGDKPAASGDEAEGTLQIDLDAELLKAEETERKPPSKVKPKTKVKTEPPRSPFELSVADMSLPADAPPKSGSKGKDAGATRESAKLKPDSSDEEVNLGELPGGSGINLSSPDDSGINLEKAGVSSSDEFELSLEAESTPRPAKAQPESDSEFELTLDVESSDEMPALEEESPPEEGEKDIFETDFDMPALDEESGSEAVALEDADTDLESSDFDLSLSEEESSGSQVVALEEGAEEADEGAATIARPSAVLAEEEEAEEEPDLLAEEPLPEELEEGEEVAEKVVAAAPPARWGLLEVIPMLFCVPIMFLVGLMSWELIQNMWGYKQSYKPTGALVKSLTETLLGEKLPD